MPYEDVAGEHLTCFGLPLGDTPTEAGLCDELLVSARRMPPEASLPDSTSESELPMLEVAAFNFAMIALPRRRAGMATAFRKLPISPPIVALADPAAADDALTVKGVAELGVEVAILRDAREGDGLTNS